MIRASCVLVSLSLLVLACSNDEPPSGPRSSSSGGVGDTAPDGGPAAGSNTVEGTIGGKTFIPTSSLAHAGRGYVHGEIDVPAVDLIFGSVRDVCATAKQDRFVPGATYVMFHDVRAAVGSDTVNDAEVFTVAPNCPSGASLEGESGRTLVSVGNVTGAGATVTLTRLDAERVEGTVSAKFDDLSSFEGSFSLVPCTGPASGGFGDEPVCD